MKIIVTAIALAFATSAAAQTAPAAPHADHAQHQAAGHAGHHPAPAQHQAGQPHAAHQAGEHQGHVMAEGCCADRNGNGVMDCCETMAASRPAAAAPAPTPQGHSNH